MTDVCADKTGTLTENRMAARELYVEGRAVQVEGGPLAPTGTFRRAGRTVAAGAVAGAARGAADRGALLGCRDHAGDRLAS